MLMNFQDYFFLQTLAVHVFKTSTTQVEVRCYIIEESLYPQQRISKSAGPMWPEEVFYLDM